MAAFNVKKIFEEVRPLYNFEFELKDEQISVIESILEKSILWVFSLPGLAKVYVFIAPFDS